MQKYIGMKFHEWCALDPDDTRRIVYTLYGFWDGAAHVEQFTSDDVVSIETLGRIREATINGIDLDHNEWVVVLCYNDDYPRYVKTADGYIGSFVKDDFELGAMYRFPGGVRYADAWELAHGSNDRAELVKEVQA